MRSECDVCGRIDEIVTELNDSYLLKRWKLCEYCSDELTSHLMKHRSIKLIEMKEEKKAKIAKRKKRNLPNQLEIF